MRNPDQGEPKQLTMQTNHDLLVQAQQSIPWTTTSDPDVKRQQSEATVINEEMVRQMEARRQARAEKRQPAAVSAPVVHERRRVCAFCCQRGDHATPAQCLRALER